MAEPRIVKKYPNRRLYDTEISRYITLGDLRESILKGVKFQVMDANTGDDITRNILLQIITEQESGGTPLFTVDILTQMIRFYGDSARGVFTEFLAKSMELFGQQQAMYQQQVEKSVGVNPIDTIAEMAQRNIEIWSGVQESFLKSAGIASSKEKEK
ncbi:polyhydroxyalkanoate synthesis repressor PhaR [Pseudomonadota bacterium]